MMCPKYDRICMADGECEECIEPDDLLEEIRNRS